MLVGRVVETEAAYLDSGIGAALDGVFGNDALALGRDLHLAAADFIGAAPYVYAAQDAGFLDDIVDFAEDVGDAVKDVATSIGDRAVDAFEVVGEVIQIIAGPVLDTAQTWFDKVRSWGGAAASWILRTGELIGRGIAEYGGVLDEWLHSIPVIATIYEGIIASARVTMQVFTLVPRLGAVVMRGDNLASFIEAEYKQFGANVGAVAEFAALIASFVPGIGQLAGPALALCAGLLQGKDLSTALIGAVCACVPGGPLVQAGAQFGARVGAALIKGERIDRAALAGLKAALPENARAAFVAAVELAQGESFETALKKAIDEGLPIDELLKSAGIELPKLGDFADVLRFKDYPDSIRDMTTALRNAGGTVLAQVDLKVSRFPSMAEAEALVLKVGSTAQDARAMGDALVAIAAYGGARVEVFNAAVCPLTIKPRLDALQVELAKGGGTLLAIGDRAFGGSAFMQQAASVRQSVYEAVRVAAASSADVEKAAANAFNETAAALLERTIPGGARRAELGAGVVVIYGRTQGAPRYIDAVRANVRTLQGGSLLRLIQAGKIKISLGAELRASKNVVAPSSRLLRSLDGPYVDPKMRSFRDALNVPTVIPSWRPQAATALPRLMAQAARTAPLLRTLPIKLTANRTTQGIEMRSYYYNPMRESQGIDPSNRAVYIVETGDGPIRIAKKITGDGNRWRELVSANPAKATKKTGPDAGNFVTLRVGERLNIPKSWETAVEKGITPSGAVVQPVIVLPEASIGTSPYGQPDTTLLISPTPGPSANRIVPADPSVAPPSIVKITPTPAPTPTPTPAIDLSPGPMLGGMDSKNLYFAGLAILGGWLLFSGKRRKA
jgi:nucleoid-associated protein YgaU